MIKNIYPTQVHAFFKALVFCLACLVTGNLQAQTQLYFQDFNSGSYPEWTLNSTAISGVTTGKNYWYVSDDYKGGDIFFATTPNEPAGVVGGPKSIYMHITSTTANSLGFYEAVAQVPATGNKVAAMNMPIVTTGYNNVTLSFYYVCDGGANYYGELYYSLDGGTTWVQEPGAYATGQASAWAAQITLTNPAWNNAASLEFAFVWAQGGGTGDTDPALGIDDIKVVGTPSNTCDVTIAGEDSTNPTCNGLTNGTLTLTATDTAAGAVLTYHISNGITADSNTTGLFTGLAPGTYAVSVSDTGCTTSGSSIFISNPAAITTPTAANNAPLCAGDSLKLTASTVAGATYAWTGPQSFSIQNPVIAVTTLSDSGTYYVVATVGGCSSAKDSTHVVIHVTPATPVAGNNGPLCLGDSLKLTASTVAGASYTWTGPMGFTVQNPILANAAFSDSGTYSVYTTIGSCNSDTVTTHVIINPAPAVPVVSNNGPLCTGDSLKLSATSTTGATYAWTGPESFSVQYPVIPVAALSDSGVYHVVVTLDNCTATGSTDVVINTINPTPFATNNGHVCLGDSLKLGITSIPGATYTWTGPLSFNIQNPVIPNSAFSDSGTYSVFATLGTCHSDTVTTHVIINPVPAPPTASNNGPLCAGDSLKLSAATTAGATYAWTGPQTFNIQNPVIPITTLNDSGVYNVVVVLGNCHAAGSTHVVINPTPSTPVASNNGPLCQGDSLKLSASTIAGAIYTWAGPNSFSVQNPVISNTVFSDSGIYSVFVSLGNCKSNTATTHVVINPSPSTPVVTNNGPLCAGDNLKLIATSSAGASYAWTGPNTFSVQNPVLPATTLNDSGVYHVVASLGTCTATGSTDVVINFTPVTPVVSNNGPLCEGGFLMLNASGTNGAVYNFYGPNSFIGFEGTFTNVPLSDSGIYSVVAREGNCVSDTGTTHVVIYPSPDTPIVGNNGPLCTGDSLKLTASSTAGSTYTWSGPNSFSIQNPVIPVTTLGDSGVYQVVVTLGSCTASGSTDVVISPAPSTPIASNNGPVCAGTTLHLNATGPNGITYTWTGPVNFNTQNPFISDVTLADSGVYTVIASAGTCTSGMATTHVVVNPSPSAPIASNNGPLCAGDMLQLSATLISGATYSWTGPESFSVQNPVINTTIIGDSGIYIVIAKLGACSSAPDSTDVVILAAPGTPVATNNGPLCTGNTLQLSATGNALFTYTWTGPNNFSTQNPVLSNITLSDSGTYTVIASAGSCSSAPASTTVVINQTPASPTVSSNSPLCVGDELKITASTDTGGSYLWTGPGSTYTAQNLDVPGITRYDSGLYVLVVTEGSCSSLPDSLQVIVITAPATPVASNNGPACLGSSLQLTAIGDTSLNYIWTGPNGFNSQNPLISNLTFADTGTYAVIATAGTCSSAPDSTYVIAIPLPATPVATNSGPVCQGGDLQLSADTVAGANYTWTGPNSFSTQNPAISSIALSDSGVYYLFVTVGGCNSSADSTDVVVIPSPVPPAISSNAPICAGDTLKLTAGPVNGASYSWSGPYNFNIQNPQKDSATVADSGVYSLVIFVDGCGSSVVNELVVVHALPPQALILAGNNDTAICPNDTATICVQGSYAAYSWNTGSTGSCISTSNPGNYYVTVTDANGCTASSNHQQIKVYTSPSVSISVTGDTLYAYNATNYQWYYEDSLIANANSNVYVAPRNGQYSVQVTDSVGCSAFSSTVTITTVGIQYINNKLIFQLFPNPATGQLTLEMTGGDTRNTDLRIFDASGRLIYATPNIFGGNNSGLNVKSAIDISGFAPGVYLLELGGMMKEFVKQ